MHKFVVGFVAIMHYDSYVPELDLKPVQFVFNHQVSIIIIHIPTLKQQMVYVTYLQTNVWWVQYCEEDNRQHTIYYVIYSISVLHILTIFIHVYINIDKYISMYILIFQHCIKNKINNTNIIKSYSKYDLRNAILEPK